MLRRFWPRKRSTGAGKAYDPAIYQFFGDFFGLVGAAVSDDDFRNPAGIVFYALDRFFQIIFFRYAQG